MLTFALYTVVAMLLTGFGFPLVATISNGDDVKAEFSEHLGKAAFGFREGAIILAPIAVIIASINGVVNILEASGVPGVLLLALLDLSGGVMIVALILVLVIGQLREPLLARFGSGSTAESEPVSGTKDELLTPFWRLSRCPFCSQLPRDTTHIGSLDCTTRVDRRAAYPRPFPLQKVVRVAAEPPLLDATAIVQSAPHSPARTKSSSQSPPRVPVRTACVLRQRSRSPSRRYRTP